MIKKLNLIFLSMLLMLTMIPMSSFVKEADAISTSMYTVKYDANGGSGTMSNSVFLTNVSYPLKMNSFTRSGYKFRNWSTGKAGNGKVFSDGATVRNLAGANQTVTLYAQWDAVSSGGDCVVTFQGNGGKTGNGKTTYTQTLKKGHGKLTGCSFGKGNEKFLGWGTSATSTVAKYYDGETIDITGNITLYALWSGGSSTPTPPPANKITVTFKGNGGVTSSNKSSYTQSLTNGKGSLSPCYFARKGYTFLGWSTDSKATSGKYYDGQSVTFTKDTTLYAIWKQAGVDGGVVETVKVTFKDNGSTGGKMGVQRVVKGKATALHANKFKKSYYNFKGWSLTKNGAVKYKDKAKITVTKNTTLYAVWKVKPFKLTKDKYVKKGSSKWNISGTASSHLGDCRNLQSLACDGSHLYAVFRNGSSNYGRIIKYNLDSKSYSKRSDYMYLGHANDMTYNPKDGCLYITRDETGDLSLTKVRASDLKSKGTVKTKIPSSVPGVSNAKGVVKSYNGIAYRNGHLFVRGRFANSIILKLNDNYKAIKGYQLKVQDSRCPYCQGMDFNGKVLNFALSKNYVSSNCYLGKGKLRSGYHVASFKNTDTYGELEGVIKYNGHMYIGVKKDSSHHYLKRVS